MYSLSIRHPSSARRALLKRAALLPVLLALLGLALLWPQPGRAQSATPTIHVPHYSSLDPAKGAIFWFGSVDRASNTANVRMSYSDNELGIVLHIFDRRTVYDEANTAGRDLTQWDSVSLYMDTQGDLSAPLGSQSYRFDGQLSHWQERTNYQRAYRWQGGWQAAAMTFTTASGYRGVPNDGQDDRGWTLSFRIPFASLGLSAPPANGAMWRMGLVLHDRDDATQALLADKAWPSGIALNRPATWGRIAFGAPVYTPPAAANVQTLTLRHGVNNIVAPDGEVGGHSMCGSQFSSDFFNGWGDANYNGIAQINIQNQWDVADWPCFSRYYVTFPLASLPSTTQVVSATLTMYMFGNAGYDADDAQPSFIQVASVAEDWNEQTLTWNNAPLVLENYSWTVVNPMRSGDPAARPVTWDVTGAAAAALSAGQPLRLALYSSDGDYHSGKYFWSADAGENLRPTLRIAWGDASGLAMSVLPIRQNIAPGETAEYQLAISGLRAGETATVETGPSSPAGLEVTVTPASVGAPGGTVSVTLKDQGRTGANVARLHRVPIKVRSAGGERTTELVVFVSSNPQYLFLPALSR